MLHSQGLSPEKKGKGPGIEKSCIPGPLLLISFPPRAEDEAAAPTGQLVPGAHPVPGEPVPGAAALGKGAFAPGSFPRKLRACPPQQAGPYCSQGEWLLFVSEERRQSIQSAGPVACKSLHSVFLEKLLNLVGIKTQRKIQ